MKTITFDPAKYKLVEIKAVHDAIGILQAAIYSSNPKDHFRANHPFIGRVIKDLQAAPPAEGEKP